MFNIPNPFIDSTLLTRIEIVKIDGEVVYIDNFYHSKDGKTYERSKDGVKEVRYRQHFSVYNSSDKDITADDVSKKETLVIWQWSVKP